MTDITIRKIEEGIANALTEQAEKSGLSREALVKQILTNYVSQIGIPRKGFMAYAENGTKIRLINTGDEVIGTTTRGPGLTQIQANALRRADLMCQPKNGSKWADARKLLVSVGLEVYEL